MATLNELRDRFLSMLGDKKEAAKAATLDLDPPPPNGLFGIAAQSSDYVSWNTSVGVDAAFAPFRGTVTVTRAEPREVVVPPQPEGSDVAPTLVDGEAAAYARTCKAIGYEPAALVVEELLAFMQEKRIKRYDNAKVGEYLSAKAKKALGPYGVWYWRPLRAQDAGEEHGEQGASESLWDSTSSSDGSRRKPYQQAIPLRVLARVEQFIQEFGDKVRFLVSDYAEQKPDPFIAVVPKQGGVDPIVFDVWDEPDFK